MNDLNKKLSIEMIAKDPGAWEFGKYVKNNKIVITDKSIATEALKKDGMLLNFCSDEIKNDYNLVEIAVTKNGMALDYASPLLKDHDSIVKIAMKLNQAIVFASSRIKKSKEFALISLKYNPNDIRFYSNEIKYICGTGKMQKSRLEKSIESEKLAQHLNEKLENKTEHKIKIKI